MTEHIQSPTFSFACVAASSLVKVRDMPHDAFSLLSSPTRSGIQGFCLCIRGRAIPDRKQGHAGCRTVEWSKEGQPYGCPSFVTWGEKAVRDAGLWMSRLLFIRAEGADEVHGIIRRVTTECPADRPRFAVRLTVAEELAAPVALVHAISVGTSNRTLEETAVL